MPQAQRRRVTFEWHDSYTRNGPVADYDRCGVVGTMALTGKVYNPSGMSGRWWWLVRTEDDRLFVTIPAYEYNDEVLVTYAADPEYIAQAVRALCDRVGLLI